MISQILKNAVISVSGNCMLLFITELCQAKRRENIYVTIVHHSIPVAAGVTDWEE